MNKSIAETFVRLNEETVADLSKTAVLREHVMQQKVEASQFENKFYHLKNTKKKAHLLKWKATENLERYLLDFESNFTKRGGQVIWANDAEEAQQEIEKILVRHSINAINRPHDMILEEIRLDDFAKENEVALSTFDMGRHILSLRQESPSHFNNPTIHLSDEEILAHISEGEDSLQEESSNISFKLSILRKQLREQHPAEPFAFISGADFLVADTGSIALQDSEGNHRLAGASADTHIVIAGINTIVSSINDLDYLWPLYASHADQQQLCTNHILWNGPRKHIETDGPTSMYVILLDNGRSNLLAQKEQRQGLYCMQCGSCLNNCNYYQLIGAKNYQTTYFGPIGVLNTPYLEASDDYPHFSYAASLQVDAKKICPADIDLERLLLLNRRDDVVHKKKPKAERKIWKRFAWFMKTRKRLDFFGSKWKSYLLKRSLKKYWGGRKDFPKPTQPPFSKQWSDNQR